ncbi:MAG: glycosyltransferase family 2 protein [Burkholderiales bacterium]
MTPSPQSTLLPAAAEIDDAALLVAAAALPAHRVSVVVPMYNERDNATLLIDAVQTALADYPWPWELIVVDDGSRDGTADVLEKHGKAIGPHIRVVRLWRNFRQTAAMQAGIDAARGDVIVTLDGDLQNDPRDIPRLVGRLLRDDLDLVAGWRMKRQDGWVLRKIPSKIANRLIRGLTKLPFRDLGCSLKAYRADVLKQVRLYGEMHRFIPAWLATVTSPARMAEEPVRHHARTQGESKYGISRTFRVIVDLFSVYFFLNFGQRPGHFFGVLGMGVSALGGLILAYMGVLKFVLGEPIGGRPLLILGFFAVIAGLQFMTTGVLSELLIRVYYGQSDTTPTASQYYAREGAEPVGDAGWHQPDADGAV